MTPVQFAASWVLSAIAYYRAAPSPAREAIVREAYRTLQALEAS